MGLPVLRKYSRPALGGPFRRRRWDPKRMFGRSGHNSPGLCHNHEREDIDMELEFREWQGVRMTFVVGKREPVWLVASLVKKLGHIPRAARRLRWNRMLVREAWNHAEWNAEVMRRERQSAMEAGFRSDLFADSPHALVFPAKELRNRPGGGIRRRRRSRACRWESSRDERCERCGREPSNPTDLHCFTDRKN